MRIFLALTLAMFATSPSAQTTLAEHGLKARIEHLTGEPSSNEFELGMLQTLRAVEITLQSNYEFGLSRRLTGLPILRLGSGGLPNPSPRPSDPGTITRILGDFAGNISTARIWLKTAETNRVKPFEMTLGDIWFDINANGTRERGEGATTSLGAIVLGRGAFSDFSKSDAAKRDITIRFDHSDHAWLLAYTHMLSGISDLYLAFDPEPVLRNLADKRKALANAPEIPNYYDLESVKADIAQLEAEEAEIKPQIDVLQAQVRPLESDVRKLRSDARSASDENVKAELDAEITSKTDVISPLRTQLQNLRSSQRFIRNELRAARLKLPGTTTDRGWLDDDARTGIDLIFVILASLQQTPDADRIRSAHAHMIKMIAHNRVFWARLAAETDNDKEWIPNATQNSALPLIIPDHLAESWQQILQDVEAVLEGKLLIPHPLLPEGYGISVFAYVNNPSSLDLLNWVHGIGAYRYAARGPLFSPQSWRAFQRLALGNAGGFALFFN